MSRIATGIFAMVLLASTLDAGAGPGPDTATTRASVANAGVLPSGSGTRWCPPLMPKQFCQG